MTLISQFKGEKKRRFTLMLTNLIENRKRALEIWEKNIIRPQKRAIKIIEETKKNKYTIEQMVEVNKKCSEHIKKFLSHKNREMV